MYTQLIADYVNMNFLKSDHLKENQYPFFVCQPHLNSLPMYQ